MGFWEINLPREAAESPPLEMLKAKFDGAIWSVEGVPAHGRRLEMDNL